MRTIFVGIEYAGKTTLIQLLTEYYRRRQQRVHGDDHFTIPDSTLSPESRQLMVGFPRDVKERMQRMQIHYHVEVIKNYANTLISGWHMEEAVYSAAYGDDPDNPYYANYGYGHQRLYETMVLEQRLPDIVLIHLTASDEAIRERMSAEPHEFQIIKEKTSPISRNSSPRRSTSVCSPTRGGRSTWIPPAKRRLNRWTSCCCCPSRWSPPEKWPCELCRFPTANTRSCMRTAFGRQDQ